MTKLTQYYIDLLDSLNVGVDSNFTLTTKKSKPIIDGFPMRIPTKDNIDGRWVNDERAYTLYTPHLEDVVRGQHKSAVWTHNRIEKVLNVLIVELADQILDTIDDELQNPYTAGIIQCIMARKTGRSKSIMSKTTAKEVMNVIIKEAGKGRLCKLVTRKAVKLNGETYNAGIAASVPTMSDMDTVDFKRTMDAEVYMGLIEGIEKFIIQQGVIAVSNDGDYARFLALISGYITILDRLRKARPETGLVPMLSFTAEDMASTEIVSLTFAYPQEQYSKDNSDTKRELEMSATEVLNQEPHNTVGKYDHLLATEPVVTNSPARQPAYSPPLVQQPKEEPYYIVPERTGPVVVTDNGRRTMNLSTPPGHNGLVPNGRRAAPVDDVIDPTEILSKQYNTYGQPAPQSGYGYAAPTTQSSYGQPPAQPTYGYATPPAQSGYGYGAPAAQPTYGYATPPAQSGYGAPQSGYGYTAPTAQPSYGYTPPAQSGYGYAAQPSYGQPQHGQAYGKNIGGVSFSGAIH